MKTKPTEPLELWRDEKRVRVVDGDRPGVYILPVYHQMTCLRTTGSDDCNCDALMGQLEFLYGPEGAN